MTPSHTVETSEELLTMKEFATLFQRNLSHCYTQARRGHESYVRIAGVWYVRVWQRDILAREARNTRKSA